MRRNIKTKQVFDTSFYFMVIQPDLTIFRPGKITQPQVITYMTNNFEEWLESYLRPDTIYKRYQKNDDIILAGRSVLQFDEKILNKTILTTVISLRE